MDATKISLELEKATSALEEALFHISICEEDCKVPYLKEEYQEVWDLLNKGTMKLTSLKSKLGKTVAS